MKCKYFTVKSKKYKKYCYCRYKKIEINYENCKKCAEKEYKTYKKMAKKSKTLAKLERNRKSILTKDMDHCLGHITFKKQKIPKDDIHEIYGGRNRIPSMKHDFTAPLCRACHEDEFIQQWLKEICQKEFEKTHTREEFLEIIDMSYID